MNLSQMAHPSSIAICTLAILLYCILLRHHRKNETYHKYPRVQSHVFMPKFLSKSPNKLFQEGYNDVIKKINSPFVVKWWCRDYLLLPAKYLPDLRRMKPENASFLKNFSDVVGLQYSVGRLYESDRMGEILRKGMNPRLGSLVPEVAQEICAAIETEVGHSKDWKSFKATDFLVKITHRIVSRSIAGSELQQSERFIDASRAFSNSVFATGYIVAQLPVGPLRPVVSFIFAQYHKIVLRRVMALVQPVVKKRMAEVERLGGKTPEYGDSIQWALEMNNPPKRCARVVSLEMLHILQAAAGAPAALMTEAIFQFLVERKTGGSTALSLREEMEEVSGRFGFTNEATLQMPRMDSFLMEVNRMFPVGGVTAARTIVGSPVTLHDGTVLPVGTRIGFPCKALHRDDELYPRASDFRGERFWELNNSLRQTNRNETQTTDAEPNEATDDNASRRLYAAMTSPSYLPWGYGAHACPGRFFAIKLAKLVMMAVLLNYDVEWADDAAKVTRPSSLELEGQFLPSMTQQIRIRAKTSISLATAMGLKAATRNNCV